MKKSKLKSRDSSSDLIKTHSVEKESTLDKKPHFSFEYIQPSYCISKCDKKDKISLIDQLRVLGSTTWKVINNAPRHGLGSEIINRDSLQVNVPDFIKPDVKLLAFRFSGKKPMIGFKEGQIFHIVWIDRDYTVYKHS